MQFKHLLATALFAVTGLSQAGVVVGGSALVNAAGLTQLETWLGQGELTLTNIFTKTPGAGSVDFHTAVDGKGATFSLMEVSGDNGQTWKVIGGYNPLSWNSINAYTSSLPDDYDAFIFNLTDNIYRAQTNSLQTYNSLGYGPTFGGGHDIYVDNNLSAGYSFGYSYGNGFPDPGVIGSEYGSSIVDMLYYTTFQLRELEVFSIGAFIPPGPGNDVPEPGTLLLLGAGALAIGLSRRKQLNMSRT